MEVLILKTTFNMISKSSKIYIAGHTGLVGSEILKKFSKKGYSNLIYKTHSELDLINQQKVMRFFEIEKPEYVIIAAAKVGGIEANNTYRAEFIYNNLMIQTNIIHAAYINNIKKLIFLGSTCVYPKKTPQPIKEEYLLTSSLEYTNEPYAIAKIAGIKMCENYNNQYKTDFISLMPTNLYGSNDNFDLETSHVIPALMRKIHLAKCLEKNDWREIKNDLEKYPINKLNLNAGHDEVISVLKDYGITKKKVEIWGSGLPRRDFLWSADLAEACLFVLDHFSAIQNFGSQNTNSHINIGTGNEISIKELCLLIKNIVNYNGSFYFNDSKPDGTMRKQIDIEKIKKMGWKPSITLEKGLKKMYKFYKN
tara:strand:+ start:15642 stop:16739 length:1098 start_codon:yes stop_codon:yes gene_type:complete